MDLDCKIVAREMFGEIQEVDVKKAVNLRRVRKKYSQKIKRFSGEQVLTLMRHFIEQYEYRWIAFELIRYHKEALKSVGSTELKEFAGQLGSWGAVDAFCCLLAGQVWRNNQVPDDLIHSWAQSPDRWWRRAALVSTVPLNCRSQGGKGDVPRTLEVCHLLAADKDDMVVKAMSWALRELIPHDPEAVVAFLQKYDHVLAARVKREVNNKLETGLKNPK